MQRRKDQQNSQLASRKSCYNLVSKKHTCSPDVDSSNFFSSEVCENLKLGQIDLYASIAMMDQSEMVEAPCEDAVSKDGGVEMTCFTDVLNETSVHFQIIRLNKQIYAWIGCNSANLGHLHAAAPTRPNNTVSVTSILGGTSDNTGFGIARRLVLRTGLNIVLACNLPKNNPLLEIGVERKLLEKLISLGYAKPRSIDQPRS